MRKSIRALCLLLALNACTNSNRSILVKEGDNLLDCNELQAELEFAKNLGENAPERRRHILALQKQKQCITKPKVIISIGISKSFD